MQCMLDTDTCIYLIKREPAMRPQALLRECFISAIVQGELEFGVANSHYQRREQNHRALLDFLSAVQILAVTELVAQTYGEIRAALRQQAIGPNDLWIAAHALAMEMPLITNNVGEFRRVPSLSCNSWMQTV